MGERLPKSLRLAQLQRLLREAGRPLSSRELADRCGTTPRTIERDVLDLETMGLELERKGRAYRLIAGHFLPPLNLTLAEATSLYLAGRLLLRTSDERNPVIACMLEKVAELLPRAMGLHLEQRLSEMANRPENERFRLVFEQCARAWASQHQVRIRYRSAAGRGAHEYIVDPYLMEASAPSFAFYLIGYADWFKGVRTFKLERVEGAQLLETRFEAPTPEEASELLRGAWGIIPGESLRVKLRFAPEVSRRVRETLWHPSQRLEEQPDGSLLASFTVGSELELRPWVLGWGRQVEVLEPASFRERLAAEVGEMGELYADRLKTGNRA